MKETSINENLLDMYNRIKSMSVSDNDDDPLPSPIRSDVVAMDPAINMKRVNNIIRLQSPRVADELSKRIILDIYCKILPLDQSYIAGNMGTMSKDVDDYLHGHDMGASQYIKSCKEKTKAPLLEFISLMIEEVVDKYVDDNNAMAIDQIEDGMEPSVIEPETYDGIDSQLVEIGKDDEYEHFIQKLKEKTVDKVVNDVSKVIVNKKEENDIAFTVDDDVNDNLGKDNSSDGENKVDTISESILLEMVDLIGSKDIYNESVASNPDNIIGIAIRETTLRELDYVFNINNSVKKHLSAIRNSKQYIKS